MKQLSPPETLALAKSITTADAQLARRALSSGTYRVDMLVHVQGEVTVGLAYHQRIAAKADPWALLAAALSRLNGVTIEALVRDGLTADRIALGASIKEEALAAVQRIKDATDTPCTGRVRAALEVTIAPALSPQ